MLEIEVKSTYLDTFLGLCILEPAAKEEIHQFLLETQVTQYSEAQQALDAFLDYDLDDDDEWHTHDPEVDEEWYSLARKLEKIEPGLRPEFLSKPSGRKKAAFGTIWHYPTYFTQKAKWGRTLDKRNGCVGIQVQNIGMPPNVLTLDLLPTRARFDRGGPSWDKLYKNWPRMERAMEKFAKTITKDLRLVITIGEEPTNAAFGFLGDDRTLHTQEVQLAVAPHGKKFHMWGYNLSFLLVRDAKAMKMEKILFYSYHGQWFLYPGRMKYHKYGVWHDFIWNLFSVRMQWRSHCEGGILCYSQNSNGKPACRSRSRFVESCSSRRRRRYKSP